MNKVEVEVEVEELSLTQKSENVRPHSSNSIENATPLYYSQSRVQS